MQREREDKEESRSSKPEQRTVSIASHCFSLTGKIQEIMPLVADLILFLMGRDSSGIGGKLQSSGI